MEIYGLCLGHKSKFQPSVMTGAVLAKVVFDTLGGCVGNMY